VRAGRTILEPIDRLVLGTEHPGTDRGAARHRAESIAQRIVSARVIVARLQQRTADVPVAAQSGKRPIDRRKLGGVATPEIDAHIPRALRDAAIGAELHGHQLARFLTIS
jgi:hypothetical protein